MQIAKYQYREFWGRPESWSVEPFTLNPTNLIVGRNAAGKSRVLNTIAFLGSFLRGGSISDWNSGEWLVEYTHLEKLYSVKIVIELGNVSSEEVIIDGRRVLSRNEIGEGRIFYERVSQFIDFKISKDVLASVARRDSLQHPFLDPLHDWAESMRIYQFSTDMGRNAIYLMSAPEGNPENSDTPPRPSFKNGAAVVAQYAAGYQHFGEAFDKAILRDLERVGYPCLSVNAVATPHEPYVAGKLPVMLQLQESDLEVPTDQPEMSTGMFRTLAVIIHINYLLMSNQSSTVLIDDIGEGLDFKRSQALIDLLINRCEHSSMQLILTSNDRFVMNEVDLDFWHILERQGSVISVKDKHSAPEEFKSFKLTGLSNFDFFSMETDSQTFQP